MLKHVVMWKFLEEAEGRSRRENLAIAKEKMEALMPLIPQLKSMEIGIDILHSAMSYDMVLITEFENQEDYEIYLNHPDHCEASSFIGMVRSARAVVDFIES